MPHLASPNQAVPSHAVPRLATNGPSVLDLFLSTERVVGQERARRQLALLLRRQVEVAQGQWPRAEAAIVFGRTGTGKTMMARLACEASGLPFVDVNATVFTESGYAGKDLSQMFLPLLEAAAVMKDDGKTFDRAGPSVLKRDDIAEVARLASTGVVLVDEMDKWLHRQNHHTGRLDTAIQTEALKIIEGSLIYVTDIEDEVGIPFDTSRVLILCAGAFVGLVGKTLRRLDRDPSFENDEGFVALVEQQDFIRYGLIPELAGRLSKMVFLRPLQKEHLAEIISQPGGPVDELRQRFNNIGCEWQVPDVAVMYLADIALRKEVGARGIDTVLWNTFSDALFRASVAEHPMAVRLAVNQVRAELVAA